MSAFGGKADRTPAFNAGGSREKQPLGKSPEIFAALKPHLSVRELKSGEILGEVEDSVRESFFPLQK
jgi:hypothetical protein